MKQGHRLSPIDVAKGLLILMVMYNHIGNLASASGIDDNEVINFIPKTRFFTPFFMPAFFVIVGICSNFNKSFMNFIYSNVKSLLIPAVSLLFIRILVRYVFTGTFSRLEWNGVTSWSVVYTLGYWNWFLTALFTTKILFYIIKRWIYKTSNCIIFLGIIHILGIILYNVKGSGYLFVNYYFYQHALMFAIYIGIGYYIKKKIVLSKSLLYTNCGIYIVIYLVYFFLDRQLPCITSDPYLSIYDIIPHFLLSVSGCFVILGFSKIINKNLFLETLGKNTLVIYCLHFQFMFSYYEIFKVSLNDMSIHKTIISLLIMFSFTLCGCLLCSKLLNYKYFRLLLGKF